MKKRSDAAENHLSPAGTPFPLRGKSRLSVLYPSCLYSHDFLVLGRQKIFYLFDILVMYLLQLGL